MAETVDEAKSGFFLLAKKPPTQRASLKHCKQLAQAIVEEGYYREFLITLTDFNEYRYTELYLSTVIDHIFKAYKKLHYVCVPDYSPTDGRLHWHALINNFDTYKEIAQLKREFKQLGHVFVKSKVIDNSDYLFKIYEHNSKTPKYAEIQPFEGGITHDTYYDYDSKDALQKQYKYADIRSFFN